MGVNLEQTAATFEHRVVGTLLGQSLSFIAVFKITTEEETENYIRQIAQTGSLLETNPTGHEPLPMRAVAADVFVGWANPEGMEDDWITVPGPDGTRVPAEVTSERVEAFLNRQGMSRLLVAAYMDATNGNNSGRLGNSENSRGKPPGKGFKALAAPRQD
jgi:hypothetical protein